MKYFLALLIFSFSTAGLTATKYKEGMVEASSYLDRLSAHHQQGVALAKLGSERAIIPQVKEAAQRILLDEKEELTQIQKWRTEKYGIIPEEKGLETKTNLKDLKTSMKGEFDQVFLEKMIAHQQEGISLSKIGIPSLQDEAIKDFSQKNTEESEKEVTDLQLLQGSLNSRKF